MSARAPDFTAEFGANAPFVADLFARWTADPAAVTEDWRNYFRRVGGAEEGDGKAAAGVEVARTEAAPQRIGIEPAKAGGPKAGGPGGPAGARVEPIRGVAAKIVRNMQESLEIPTATSVRTIPAKLLEENRNVLNRHLAVAGRAKASYTHLIAFALVRAIREMPRLNAAFAEQDEQPVRIHRDQVNLGLAIDLEAADGTRTLVVPCIKNAGALDFDAFYRAYNDLVDRARASRLAPDDFQGTTITLTNPGTIGTIASVPRLMSGQGLILATGAIAYPPEYQASAPEMLSQLGVSRVMTVTSTYDHRIIQGAESGLLLQRIDDLLQAKDRFYEEVFEAVDCPHGPFSIMRDRCMLPAGAPGSPAEAIEKQARVLELIRAYRERGLMIADLDPLEFKPACPPELDLATYGLTIWDLDRRFMTGGLGGKPMATLREILEILLDTYSRRIGVEAMHIADPAERAWVQQRIEPTKNLEPFTPAEQRRILSKLNAAEAFERFLHTRYVGHKRFSLEGAEVLVPMLDEMLNRATNRGIRHVVMGMAHRGRLNVLVNTFNKSYERVFSEFEGAVDPATAEGSGDVKYHLGAEGEHLTPDGRRLPMTLASNPSHLEAVNPVVEGMARALQDAGAGGDPRVILPVLIHGDAAFAGQGVVSETLNMSRLAGYRTGGTVHVIIDNQIGYTAGPDETRSTRWCTDMAKSIGALILHVNGDYPESVLRAIRVAFDYREKFAHDAVVDVVCYRRWGHNETDEPAYTQPILYRKIQGHPSVRERYGRLLVTRNQMTEEERLESVEAWSRELKSALDSFRAQPPRTKPAARGEPEAKAAGDFENAEPPATGASRDVLVRCVAVATSPPAGFTVHPNLARQLAKRVEMANGKEGVDWGTAEAMAFGSLLVEGTAIRLTGQDTGRGTFSQRHAIVVDQTTGSRWIPLAQVDPGQARFDVVNSLLSEEAAVGFEFGYSVANQGALVLWEAQFGDFVNGAQIQIDQFIAASESKWGQRSGVVLLLPHGYDGQGPEHSSARLERFLQLCAGGNMTVVNCTTSGQYFHAIRRQGVVTERRPLVVMTPKSLLKRRDTASPVAELESGAFRLVIDDAEAPAKARRVLLCSGKVFYDLRAFRAENKNEDVAIVRVEQLYPVPDRALRAALERRGAREIVWVQEEPRNMGAWSFMQPHLAAMGFPAAYVGRAAAASPATGSMTTHAAEQEALVRRAFGPLA
jgi:2-oxoglutarate dehydrogenase E1 component